MAMLNNQRVYEVWMIPPVTHRDLTIKPWRNKRVETHRQHNTPPPIITSPKGLAGRVPCRGMD